MPVQTATPLPLPPPSANPTATAIAPVSAPRTAGMMLLAFACKCFLVRPTPALQRHMVVIQEDGSAHHTKRRQAWQHLHYISSIYTFVKHVELTALLVLYQRAAKASTACTDSARTFPTDFENNFVPTTAHRRKALQSKPKPKATIGGKALCTLNSEGQTPQCGWPTGSSQQELPEGRDESAHPIQARP